MPACATRLSAVAYDLRGRIDDEAARLQAAGLPVIKLNLGNPAAFGFAAPPAIAAEVARMLDQAHGYSDAQGMPSARAAVARYCCSKAIPVSGGNDIYLGNG